jgi:hypothetical protein
MTGTPDLGDWGYTTIAARAGETVGEVLAMVDPQAAPEMRQSRSSPRARRSSCRPGSN